MTLYERFLTILKQMLHILSLHLLLDTADDWKIEWKQHSRSNVAIPNSLCLDQDVIGYI